MYRQGITQLILVQAGIKRRQSAGGTRWRKADGDRLLQRAVFGAFNGFIKKFGRRVARNQ